jgi:bisphosphoglycerate-independent phosphoglycerate mutase (AlkP superfamily)
MTGRANCAKVLVLSGTAPFEITQAAKALGTDLIIMSSHGESETARQLGSTAEQVMRQAPCPVFVLKKESVWSKKGHMNGTTSFRYSDLNNAPNGPGK